MMVGDPSPQPKLPPHADPRNRHDDLRVVFLSNRRCPMPDDKSKVGEPDRSRVAADQNYEVRYLAQKFGLSDEQARELIARVGNDREKLDEAAQKLMGG
jgi:Protein of unknown function (DUF3606)